ncbi:MAG: hypothetical protein C0519_06740 [Hyphomicrobium sp.]|nr:hypothetical protein [Hyphomicrobium sp.]
MKASLHIFSIFLVSEKYRSGILCVNQWRCGFRAICCIHAVTYFESVTGTRNIPLVHEIYCNTHFLFRLFAASRMKFA